MNGLVDDQTVIQNVEEFFFVFEEDINSRKS